MKLLSKTTVQSRVQDEKRKLIDEGLSIARKIDALRETYAEEQKKFDCLRKNQLEILTKEAEALQEKNRSLENKIRSSKAELTLLRLKIKFALEKLSEIK